MALLESTFCKFGKISISRLYFFIHFSRSLKKVLEDSYQKDSKSKKITFHSTSTWRNEKMGNSNGRTYWIKTRHPWTPTDSTMQGVPHVNLGLYGELDVDFSVILKERFQESPIRCVKLPRIHNSMSILQEKWQIRSVSLNYALAVRMAWMFNRLIACLKGRSESDFNSPRLNLYRWHRREKSHCSFSSQIFQGGADKVPGSQSRTSAKFIARRNGPQNRKWADHPKATCPQNFPVANFSSAIGPSNQRPIGRHSCTD